MGLRLYDVDEGTLWVNVESEATLLDCCFEDESAAFACGSDGSVRSGGTQKQIEEDTGVKIIFPSSREESSIALQGKSAESIRKASQLISDVLEEAVQRRQLEYSHFNITSIGYPPRSCQQTELHPEFDPWGRKQ